jgi:hypothetical protein
MLETRRIIKMAQSTWVQGLKFQLFVGTTLSGNSVSFFFFFFFTQLTLSVHMHSLEFQLQCVLHGTKSNEQEVVPILKYDILNNNRLYTVFNLLQVTTVIARNTHSVIFLSIKTHKWRKFHVPGTVIPHRNNTTEVTCQIFVTIYKYRPKTVTSLLLHLWKQHKIVLELWCTIVFFKSVTSSNCRLYAVR